MSADTRLRTHLVKLSELRDAKKELSEEQLAESGDFDRTYPSLFERCLRTPTIFAAVGLAKGLNIEPWLLLADVVARLVLEWPEAAVC